MTRQPLLNAPFLLGFDTVERALDRVAKTASDGYPPYNVERLPRTDALPERLRLTLAVAGFALDDLEITVEDKQLTIRGRQKDEAVPRTYLHRGIAGRQFQKAFLLAEGMEVTGAKLADGLLAIEIARPDVARVVKTIAIADRR